MIVLIDLLGLTIIIPLLPLYAASFGANAFIIGALGAAYPIMQFVGAPLLGGLSDRLGRRPVLIVSQIGTFLGFILLGVSNSLILLFVSRVIDGLSGANIATAQAAISDSTTEKTRTQGLGLIGAAFGLGFIIGPIIAFITLALSDNNYRLVAFVAAGFSLASILLTTFWFKETLPPEKRGAKKGGPTGGFGPMISALKRPRIGFLLLMMFFYQFSFGGFEHLLALFTLNRLGMNASSNAALFVFVGLILVAVQGGFVGRWSRKYGDRWLILMGLSVMGIGLLLSALTPRVPVPWYSKSAITRELTGSDTAPAPGSEDGNTLQIDLPDDAAIGWAGLGWLTVAIIPISIAGGVLQPTINSLLTREVEEDETGGILGISSAFYSGANALAPLILGAVYQGIGSTAPFAIGGLILLALFLIARRRT